MARRVIYSTHKNAPCNHESEIIGVCYKEYDETSKTFGRLMYRKREDAHDDILHRGHKYWTEAPNGASAECYAATRGTTKYIETKRDNNKPDNLLNLPGCHPA